MKGLTITATAQINFSADHWELFDMPERDNAAKALNAALQEAINTPGSTANSVYQAMLPVCSKYADVGANDSEAEHLIDDVINEIYGEQ